MFRKSLIVLVGISLMSPVFADTGPTYADPAPQYIADRVVARLPDGAVTATAYKDHLLLRFPEHALFDGPGDHVSKDGIAVLGTLVEELLRQPRNKVQVIAHFHDDGDRFASQVSSQRRAMSVVAVMDSRTLPRDRVSVTAMGASYPVDTNMTPEGRAGNRRVEIVLRPLK
jgi:outer membrane protein OmpA-like peptidoglycan-associated protein